MSNVYLKSQIPEHLHEYFEPAEIGLEPTPDEFIARLVEVFCEVRRVLRNDGTCFVNMGDSYASGGRKSRDPGQSKLHPTYEGDNYADGLRPVDPPGIKPKDLLGIPWMLAFALRADGWYLRQEIIWAKKNCMPESVTDRCTKSHEHIFLLAKSPKYYFDQEAILEDVAESTANDKRTHDENYEAGRPERGFPGQANGGAGMLKRSKRDSFKREDSKRAEVIPGQTVGTHRPDRDESEWDIGKRNKRSVWTVATQPFKEAHFATFPPALIEPCILAGCPPGGTVLDPFFGAGTTGLVADRLQRNCIGIELNPAYALMARKRIDAEMPLFAAAE